LFGEYVFASNFSNRAPGANDNPAAEQFFHIANRIAKAATMCEVDLLPKASWNDEVHSQVLNLALDGWRKEEGIWYMNVYVPSSVFSQSLNAN
jgi:hypothetical protein